MIGSIVGLHADSLLAWMVRFHRGGRMHLDGYIGIEHPLTRWRALQSFPLALGDFEAMMCSKTRGLRSLMLVGKLMGQHALFYNS
jgi:hypothetical protein